jgi:putative N6-adenine-specific DNA methylase
MSAASTCFATCAPGLEGVLHAELKGLKIGLIERQVGGVRFQASPREVARVNIGLRTANRVLVRVARFDCPDEDALYAAAREIPWERWLAADGCVRVDAQVRDSRLDHSRYAEQRVKDAVVDRMMELSGTRPSVGTIDEVDVGIHLHLHRNRATLALDSSGPPLYKRGWRTSQGRAPLTETLAAGLVLLSGWDRRAPLVDPFCGSGTILVEGGWIATNRAPNIERSFAFQRWADHDKRSLERERQAARDAITPRNKLRLWGADWDTSRVMETEAHLEATGLGNNADIHKADAKAFTPRDGWSANIVTNPPWGERVGSVDELVGLYSAFGQRLREHGSGCHLTMLSSEPRLLDAIAMPGPRTPLPNGATPCTVLRGEVE